MLQLLIPDREGGIWGSREFDTEMTRVDSKGVDSVPQQSGEIECEVKLSK